LVFAPLNPIKNACRFASKKANRQKTVSEKVRNVNTILMEEIERCRGVLLSRNKKQEHIQSK
jgi:hypothetical protein